MKINSIFNKSVLAFSCTILAFSGFTMSIASAETPANEYAFNDSVSEDLIYLQELGLEGEDDFYDLMIAIESLPEYDEENLQQKDIQEIAQFLSDEINIPVSVEQDSINLKLAFPNEVKTLDTNLTVTKPTFGTPRPTDPTIGTMGFTPGGALACIGALGTLIPVVKILKIKKVLKAAGGAVTVMKQVFTNYKYYRNTKKYSKTKAINQAVADFSVKKQLSSGSKALLADFFSISAIAGGCSSLFSFENNSETKNYIFDKNKIKNIA